jgi:hypothetical protein
VVFGGRDHRPELIAAWPKKVCEHCEQLGGWMGWEKPEGRAVSTSQEERGNSNYPAISSGESRDPVCAILDSGGGRGIN